MRISSYSLNFSARKNNMASIDSVEALPPGYSRRKSWSARGIRQSSTGVPASSKAAFSQVDSPIGTRTS